MILLSYLIFLGAPFGPLSLAAGADTAAINSKYDAQANEVSAQYKAALVKSLHGGPAATPTMTPNYSKELSDIDAKRREEIRQQSHTSAQRSEPTLGAPAQSEVAPPLAAPTVIDGSNVQREIEFPGKPKVHKNLK